MGRVHCNSERLHGYPITHFSGDGNTEEVHCNINKLHGFPVTHFGDDNVEEARYGDRLHGEQKDTRHTIRKLGDRPIEVLVAETF